MFGSGGFGSTPSAFGTPPAFGTTTNAGSVFGQPAQPQPTTNLFGGGNTAFGIQQNTLPAFGSATTATGAFGAQPATPNVFGQQARPAGIFSSTANNMGGPFSIQTQAAGTSIPFNAITATDSIMKNGVSSQISTRHQCITSMKQYENKSMEELRLEDYQLNRKGPQTSMFGGGATPQPQQGLFSSIGGGATSTPGNSTFGQTSAFGQAAGNTGGLFGSSLNQPKPGGFFGSGTTPTTNAFGGGTGIGFNFTKSANQQQQSIFGANNNPATSNTGFGTTSAFSFNAQPQQQQQGLNLFGQKPLTTTSTSSAPTFGGGFGNTATNNTLNKSMFGGSTGATFGQATATPSFGSATGLFSNTQQQQQKPFAFSNPFSSTAQATSQPAFGGPTSSTSAFSFSKAVSTPSVNFGTAPTFGNTTGSTGTGFGGQFSFSNTQQQQQPPTGTTFGSGLFSNLAGATGTGTGLSLFGSSTGNSTLGTGFGTGGLQLYQPPNLQLQQQQQQQQIAQTTISFATTPFKDNQLFYNLISNRKLEELARPTNPEAQRQLREASRRKSCGTGASTFSYSPALRNVTFPTASKHSSITKFDIFDGFKDDDLGVGGVDILSPKTDVKRLVLKGDDDTSSSTDLGLARRASMLVASGMASEPNLNSTSPLQQRNRNRISMVTSPLSQSDLNIAPESGGGGGAEANRTLDFGDSSLLPINDLHHLSNNQNNSLNQSRSSTEGGGSAGDREHSQNDEGPLPSTSKRSSEVGGTFLDGSLSSSISNVAIHGSILNDTGAGGICGVICTRPGYFTKPSLEELDRRMDADGNCFIPEFEVGRHHYGKIRYLQPVNAVNINIDEIVLFTHKEVIVYPDDEKKPELGEGLNAPAEIELERVWPIDKSTNELVRSPMKVKQLNYEAKLRKACDRLGAEFLSYDEVKGVWRFKVNHFSKYSCDLEENEDDEVDPQPQQQPKGLGGIPQQKLPHARKSLNMSMSTMK